MARAGSNRVPLESRRPLALPSKQWRTGRNTSAGWCPERFPARRSRRHGSRLFLICGSSLGELPAVFRLPLGSSTFDLPGVLSRRRRRADRAVSRAAALFEVAIPTGHNGFLEAYIWPPGDLAHSPNSEAHLLGLLPDNARPSAVTGELSDFWGDNESDLDRDVVRLTVPLELRQLDYRSLFQFVAHEDLGLTPTVGARVYLVDETDPLIFLMYDDRGAILHASSADRLRPLYDDFGDWLVDHDRTAIDQLFAGER